MEHPPHPGELLHHGQAVGVGLPVVDDDGEVQVPGQLELGPKDLLLQVPGDLLPVVVQADLSDGLHLGVAGHGRHLVQPVRRQAQGVLGVDPRGGVDVGVPLRQVDGLAGGGQIAPGAQHQPHPRSGEGGQDLVPVGVKGL